MSRGLRRFLVIAAPECRDAREAVPHIDGVGDYTAFAVSDTTDAGRELLFDNFADREGQTGIVGSLLETPAGLARLEELQQIGRARQAADMGRQDAVGAVFHAGGPLLFYRDRSMY